MQRNWTRAVVAGVVGTLVMTAVGVWFAPMMGIPRMNPAEMLAGQMGGNIGLGWAAHLMVGVILAVGYAIVSPSLVGPPAVRAAIYGIAPWLLAQVAVMPMMGAPVFSGSVVLAMGSFLGHLIYGVVVGTVYGLQTSSLPLLSRSLLASGVSLHF